MEIPPVTRALHDSNFGFDRAYSPAMASEIITNNVKVAAIAFARRMDGRDHDRLDHPHQRPDGRRVGGAVREGRLTVPTFWATIAPHGVIELSAIQIAGGAGLVLAGGYLRPGRARRRDALLLAGRRAGTLVIGVALLLCVAGTIEGFVSPQRLSIPVRDAIGAFHRGRAGWSTSWAAAPFPSTSSGQATLRTGSQSRPRLLTST